jgi:hypothetical protein
MNIQTVAENLRVTIAGKEQMLALYKEKLEIGNYFKQEIKVNQTPEKITIKFLETNIDELKRILEDVEQCEPSLPGEGNNYEKWDGDE